jgi:predicted CXXCH cytochrome family protein
MFFLTTRRGFVLGAVFSVAAALIVVVVAGSGTVLADNGPHNASGFSATTDSCAGCHRTHTAPGTKLLIADSSQALCLTCHGGTGAETNVVNGLTTGGFGLKGGGFEYASMDTGVTGVVSSNVTTSKHSYDQSVQRAWGGGAIGTSASYTSIALTCVNCHNPHGNGQYRILKKQPVGGYNGDNTTSVAVADVQQKGYAVTYSASHYRDASYVPAEMAVWCGQCHTRYLAGSGSATSPSGDAVFTYRHMTSSLAGGCLKCHVAHGSSAVMGSYSGSVRWPNMDAGGGATDSRLLNLDSRGVCAQCHVSGGQVVGGCNGCHDSPPATGAHATHAGSASVGYGLTGSYATAGNYQYGCGECHPTDPSKHQDGVVDVQLSSTGAPAGSLKAKNAASASYGGGSCAGVYCHSGPQVTSGPVGSPLESSPGTYVLDSHYNLTYAPYTVARTRDYRTTPAWSGGHVASCSACHAFPLTTSVPSVQAGVGDSHQWIDNWGYGDLHAWNMARDPLACRTCHYGEITVAGTWSRNAMDVTSYADVQVASRTAHANGTADVIFDTVDAIVYGTHTYSLASANYESANQACTNVACHKLQSYVQWGSPYRFWESGECDLCHRYGSLPSPPVPLAAVSSLSMKPASAAPMAAASSHGGGVVPAGTACSTCHPRVHAGK